MSTTPVTNWNIPLSDVGPIYPFAGKEAVFVILAFAFWIGFHVWQLRKESRALDAQAREAREHYRKAQRRDP